MHRVGNTPRVGGFAVCVHSAEFARLCIFEVRDYVLITLLVPSTF